MGLRPLLAVAVLLGTLGLWFALALAPRAQRQSAPLHPQSPTEATAQPPAAQAVTSSARSGAKPPATTPHAKVIAPTSDEVRAQLAKQAQEQRVGNDQRYAVAKARWDGEKREEPWAAERERALQTAMASDGVDGLLSDVECRATMCRMEILAMDSNAAFALTRAKAFQLEVGDRTGAGMIGGGLDRSMELFVPRQGMDFDR